MKTEDSKVQEVEQPKVIKTENKAEVKKEETPIEKTTKRDIEEIDADIKNQNKNIKPEDITDKEEKKEEVNLKSAPEKTLNNTDASGAKKNVPDIEFWGNGDTFKLISKASSKSQKWMKSTKAMEIAGLGCVVQITTQQGDNIAESAVFVPGASIHEVFEDDVCTSRMLIYVQQPR